MNKETKLQKSFPDVFKFLTLTEYFIASRLYDYLDKILPYDNFCNLLNKNTKVCQQNNIAAHIKFIRKKFLENKIPLHIETHTSKGWLMKKK